MSSEKNYLNDSYKSFFEDSLSVKDPELYKAIKDELIRQQQHIELIASENIVSQAVLDCLLYTSPSPRDGTKSRMPSSA